jgi:hypothetical protein
MNMDKNPPGFMYQELTRNYYTIAKEANRGKPIQGDTEPEAVVDHGLTPYKDSFTKYQ